MALVEESLADADARTGLGLIRTAIGALVFFASYGLLMGAFPAELASRDFKPGYIGMVIGFHALGAVSFRIVAPNAIDRMGARKIAAFAALGGVFATLILGTAMIFFNAALPLLAIAKFVQGAAVSAFLTSGYAYVAQAGEPERRGKRIGIYGGIGSFGLLVPPPVGIWLWLHGGSGYFWLLPVAFALPALLLLPGDQRRPGQLAEPDVRSRTFGLLLTQAVFAPVLALAVSAAMQGGFEAHLPRFVLEFDAQAIIVQLYILFGLSVAAGRLCGGWLVDRAGATVVFFSGLASQIVAVILPLASPTSIGLVSSATIFGVGSGMVTTSAIALLAVAVPPHRSAAAIGLGGLLKDAGFATGAALAGLGLAAGGARTVLLGGLLATVLAAAIASQIYTTKSRSLPVG